MSIDARHPQKSSNELYVQHKKWLIGSGQPYVESPDFVAWLDWSDLVFMLNKN